jgi:hypothetical protein
MILTSIKAEFDTFDSADFVARKISRQVDGVTKTSIQSLVGKSSTRHGNYSGGMGALTNSSSLNGISFAGNFGIGAQVVNGGYNFTGLIPQNAYSENRVEPLRSEKSQLTITCGVNSAHHVEQVLLSSGGSNIHKTS